MVKYFKGSTKIFSNNFSSNSKKLFFLINLEVKSSFFPVLTQFEIQKYLNNVSSLKTHFKEHVKHIKMCSIRLVMGLLRRLQNFLQEQSRFWRF